MNWLDLFDDNAEADRKHHRELARVEAHGPCEDDVEVTCPFVGMMPNESEKENGSPLNFTSWPQSATGQMDRMIQEAFTVGF